MTLAEFTFSPTGGVWSLSASRLSPPQVQFSGTAGWQWESAVVIPSKPILVVYLFCLFRYREGQVDFDDVTLRTLTPWESCNGANHQLNHSDVSVLYTEDTPVITPRTEA
eukprot:7850578-Pyramimonas_sp.AAC.1